MQGWKVPFSDPHYYKGLSRSLQQLDPNTLKDLDRIAVEADDAYALIREKILNLGINLLQTIFPRAQDLPTFHHGRIQRATDDIDWDRWRSNARYALPWQGDTGSQGYADQKAHSGKKHCKRKPVCLIGPARLTLLQTALDDAIYKKETEYLEDTSYGNILIGFDNYIKGSSSTALGGGRRKAGVDDTNRVFSRSSIRYNDITVCVLFPFTISNARTRWHSLYRIHPDFHPLTQHHHMSQPQLILHSWNTTRRTMLRLLPQLQPTNLELVWRRLWRRTAKIVKLILRMVRNERILASPESKDGLTIVGWFLLQEACILYLPSLFFLSISLLKIVPLTFPNSDEHMSKSENPSPLRLWAAQRFHTLDSRILASSKMP